jgi:hypothetical protein
VVPIAGVHEWRVVEVSNTHPALEPRRGPWEDGLAREINAQLGDGWFMPSARQAAGVSDLVLAVTFVRGCVHVTFTNRYCTARRVLLVHCVLVVYKRKCGRLLRGGNTTPFRFGSFETRYVGMFHPCIGRVCIYC